MKIKKLVALLLCGAMAVASLTGCGGVDKNAAVATFDGEQIPLGPANFAARLQQAGSDDFYVMYFGEKVWSTDLYGSGTTMEQDLKDGVIESMEEMYVLREHMEEYNVSLSEEETAAIKQAATDFIAANKQDALEALGADQQVVEEYLTLLTIQTKMKQAIIAGADTNVSDAEANTSTYSYVEVSKSEQAAGEESVDDTETVLMDLASAVNMFATEAKAGDFAAAAQKYSYTVQEGTYAAGDTDLEEAVVTALNGLAEGAVSDVIDLEDSYYVVRLDAKVDAAATEETRASIIEERQDALYDEVLEGWKEGHTWTLDEKVWNTVTFDNLFTTVEESTETEAIEETEE